MLGNWGWHDHWSWQQGNRTHICAMYFSGGYACMYVLWPSIDHQHKSCKVFQVFAWLHTRKLNCTFCVGVCKDEVATTTRWMSGSTLQVRGVAYPCEPMSYVIYREMMAAKNLSPEFNILQDMIKDINHIEVNAFNSNLCSSVGRETQSTRLFLHTEMRWLSKTVLLMQHFWIMRAAQEIYKKSQLAAPSSDIIWTANLAYLCNLLNELNPSLQGKITVMFNSTDKVIAFANRNYAGNKWTLGFMTCFKHEKRFWKTLRQGLLSPSGSWSPISAFKRVSH